MQTKILRRLAGGVMWAKAWGACALLLTAATVTLGIQAYHLNQEIEHQQQVSDALIQEKQELEKQLMGQRAATAFYYEQLAGCAASVEQLIEMVNEKRMREPVGL